MHRVAGHSPAAAQTRCAFCGYELAGTPVPSSTGERCCSEHCREAYDGGNDPFIGRFDYKRFVTGISVVDALVPYGMPANSFVLLAGENGIRHRSLQTELLWRTLVRGEPAIIITYVDPPIAVVEHFLTFGWNVLPFLESGALQIIDCFTSRLRDEHQTPSHQTEWNDFLAGFLDDSVAVVHDTGNLLSVEDTLHTELKRKNMTGTGVVVIDSLNEVERQGHEFETEQFIKEVRGDVCSRKFVPIFASVTSTEDDRSTRNYTYLFDGIVEMRRIESNLDGSRLTQLGIKKMDGVLYSPYWANYVIDESTGLRLFDPGSDLQTGWGSLSTSARPASHPLGVGQNHPGR